MFAVEKVLRTFFKKNASFVIYHRLSLFYKRSFFNISAALKSNFVDTGCHSCLFLQAKERTFYADSRNIYFTPIYINVRLKTSVASAESGLVDFDKLFPLRFVYVRTSVSVWEEYPEGVQFDVGYVDTKLLKGSKSASNVPVILALPSSAGTHAEFFSILLSFVKLGYRVVIPNLPGTAFCRGRAKADEAIFTMSVEEKMDFVKDFLSELQIDRVDMLVTSGCSVYTGVRLCMFHPDLVKSLVMVNPTGVQPIRSMKPVRLHEKFSKMYDDRFVLQGVFSSLVSLVKLFTKKRDWDTCNVVTYSRTIGALSFSDEKASAGYFKSRTVPRLALYGGDTDFLDVKSTEEYLACMGIPESAITLVDQQGSVVQQGVPENGNYGIHIQGGLESSKMMFVRKQLLDFLKSVYPNF